MPEKAKAPAIRFKGFTDAWEQRKFSDIFIFLQNNSLTRADLNYELGTVKNVHYGDVLIKFGEVLDVEKEEIPFVSNEEFSVSSSSLLQNGDVIIADAAEDNTVGKCSEIKGIKGMSVVSGLHTIPCRPTRTFATVYLGYYMNSMAYHDQLLPLIQGTKISSISKSALQNTDIIFPGLEEEQRQIGSFFNNLNNFITLQQRKLLKLKNVKKAMLEKMFPKNGSNVPEIRFAGFTDAWEQRKLGELGFYISDGNYGGLYPNANEFIADGVPFIRVNNLRNGYLVKNDLVYISEALHSVLKSGHLKTEDVLITNRGQIGIIAYVDEGFDDANINAQICLIRTNGKMSSAFLHQFLQTFPCQREILSFQTGSALKQLPRKKLDEVAIKYPPSFNEQNQIGTFFNNLDNLITLHQRKYEKLQNLKKACLEKMFI